MKKVTALFFVIILVFMLLLSCQNNPETGGKSGEPAPAGGTAENAENAENTNEIPDGLPDYDFGGKSLTVISREVLNVDIFQIAAEEGSAEPINDAVYRRNLKVSERFNVNIKSILYDEPDFDSPFKKSILAGDDTFQVAAMHIIQSGVYATDGLLVDWNNIPNIDISKPWWNQTVAKNTQIGGKLFLQQNDIPTYTVICNNHIMFFNKRLAGELEIPNLYETVRQGKWTIDLLTQHAKLGTRDLNGDGVMGEEDRWGFIASTGSTSTFLAGSNQAIIAVNSDGIPEIVLNTPKMASLVDKIYDLCVASGDTYMKPIDREYDFCMMFRNGKSLFYNGYIQNCALLRDMEDEYGILPIPKFDESQTGYYAQIQGNSDTIGIPKSLPEADYEFVGAIVEALAAESYKMVRPVIYEMTLKTKFARDVESEEMLDLVSTNIVIDFGFLYNNWQGFGFTIWDLMERRSSDFASYYERNFDKAQKNYDRAVEAILKIE